jgi:hypothetical protein
MYIPIGNITMENLIGDTGKRCLQMPYTPRTHKIPSIKATGMEKKLRKMEHDRQELRDAQDDIGLTN